MNTSVDKNPMEPRKQETAVRHQPAARQPHQSAIHSTHQSQKTCPTPSGPSTDDTQWPARHLRCSEPFGSSKSSRQKHRWSLIRQWQRIATTTCSSNKQRQASQGESLQVLSGGCPLRYTPRCRDEGRWRPRSPQHRKWLVPVPPETRNQTCNRIGSPKWPGTDERENRPTRDGTVRRVTHLPSSPLRISPSKPTHR